PHLRIAERRRAPPPSLESLAPHQAPADCRSTHPTRDKRAAENHPPCARRVQIGCSEHRGSVEPEACGPLGNSDRTRRDQWDDRVGREFGSLFTYVNAHHECDKSKSAFEKDQARPFGSN